MSTPNARIEVVPADGLVDEPLDIRLSGLKPGEQVTLQARVDFSGQAGTWSTSALYEADADGALDLNAQAPISGDFAEADANAFIWSLRPQDLAANARSLAEGLAPYHLRFRVETGGGVIEQSVVRRAVAEDVNIVEVREPSIQANLFLPDGPGPFPAVLVLGGSGGDFPTDRPRSSPRMVSPPCRSRISASKDCRQSCAGSRSNISSRPWSGSASTPC